MPPNDPFPVNEEAQALLRAAEKDAKTVEVLLRHPDAPNSSICFHAQQYLEKSMKAVLVSIGVVFRRTHDLDELADLLEKNDIDTPITREELRTLNPYAVIIRYEDIELSLIDTDSIESFREKTRKWIDTHLFT